MTPIDDLLKNNRSWAARMRELDPAYFEKLAQQQAPEYLWIGCSDSRVPANQITGLAPGEVFVHRNIANVVVHTDLNCLSVIQFAIEHLRVRHVIVCGHYGCSGVRAALAREKTGLADNWLRHVQDVHARHARRLAAIRDVSLHHDCLCELNVLEQVANVCQTTAVQDAWERGQSLSVHSWIYRVRDGLLRDLGLTVDAAHSLQERYDVVLARLFASSPAGSAG